MFKPPTEHRDKPRGGISRPRPDRARALRGSMTLPEIILWRHLKNRQLGGLRFHRQHPMLGYVLDFYCREHRLAVEVDGRVHDHPDQVAHDRRRDERLRSERDILTLRIPAVDILAGDEPLCVLELILLTAQTRPPLTR